MSKTKFVAVCAAVALGALGACGGGDKAASGGDTTGASASAEKHNDADVLFAQSMIPHHEQAIEMADIALDPTVDASAEVVALAEQIKGAQDPEIQQMTEWLESWDEPVAMDSSGGHDMSSMKGMMSASEMDALGEKTGTDFDRAWMEMMIEHHEGAISMAETVKKDGENSQVKKLADAIISGQQAEIDEMKKLLA